MITQQVQIKLNLPLALKDYLESKAQKFDMPMASYIKHLILNDVADLEYPVYEMSDRSQKKLKQAIKNKNKAIKVTDVTKFMKSLQK